MGMYTSLVFHAVLDLNGKDNIKNILDYMLGLSSPSTELPNHPLFNTQRWSTMLRHKSWNIWQTSCIIFDEVTSEYNLSVTCRFKNYDGEIEKFIDWIMPYVDQSPMDFLGYFQYEEFNLPNLIFNDIKKPIHRITLSSR